MSAINDGGPAFALSHPYYGPGIRVNVQEGMSLRDWFAGMALSGYAGRACMNAMDTTEQCRDGVFYEMADAMLTARERKEQP